MKVNPSKFQAKIFKCYIIVEVVDLIIGDEMN